MMQSERQQDRVEDIRVDSFIWSQEEQSSRHQEMSSFQIYTVSKNIKNPKILEHIKPDYGSLGQFMKNVALSKDLLLHNRKKKNEQQEDLQQKKLRSILKNQNLDKVLKEENSTPLEKTIASKMIVENLFQNKFGTGLQNFCSQNAKLENLRHSHASVSELANMLDNIMIESKKDNLVNFQLKHQAPVLSRRNHMLSSKEIESLTEAQKLQKLKNIQQNYASLKKTSIDAPQVANSGFSPLEKGVLTFSKSILNLSSISTKLLRVEFQSLRSLRLIEVSVSQDLLSLLLDYFTDSHCVEFRELIVEKCFFTNTEKLSERIKTFIEQSRVMRVELNEIGLSSRDFCLISLGIGCRNNFQFLGLKNNKISQISKKCLDVLLKFHKQSKFNFLGNPIQSEIKGRPGYSRCFS